jgi:hypothetical protein
MDNNDFPLELVFPNELIKIVEDLNKHQGFPKEFTSCSLLYAISVAIGNNFHIKVRESWTMNCSIYLVLVGPAGSMKSAPLTFAIEPLSTRDDESYRVWEVEKKTFDANKKLTEKERIESAILEPVEPILKKFIVNDATMEALQDVLRNNPRGVGVYHDEWRDWYLNLDRFNNGTNKPKMLSLWSGTRISIDRKGGLPIRIKNPFLSLAGTTQTDLLYELYKGENAVSGFLDRFLICSPKDLKRKRIEESEGANNTEHRWNQLVNKILSFDTRYDEFGNVTSSIVPYARECKSELKEFEDYINGSINQETFSPIKSYYSKVETYTHRFALIFQMLQTICEEGNMNEISIISFNRAKSVMEYFSSNTISILEQERENKLRAICKDLLTFEWYNKLNDQFKTHEAKECLQSIIEILEVEKMSIEAMDKKTDRYLSNTLLFEKISHGLYRKLY